MDPDRLGADLPAFPRRKDLDVDPGLEPVVLIGLGNETIVRDGWRSASPDSTSSAASIHSGGTHAVWVITLVR